MGGGEALRIKKAYKKFLLAFEQHLSQGTTVEIRKVSGSYHAALQVKPEP